MAEQRSQSNPVGIAKFLKGVDFPVDKQQLLQHAKQQGAMQEVIQSIQQLEDRQYNSMSDVEKSFGRKAA